MRFYFDTATKALGSNLFDDRHLSTAQPIKRGDTDTVEIVPKLENLPVDLDPEGNAETLKFGAKVVGGQDGSYVFFSSTWVKSNGTVFTDAVTNETTAITSATAVFNADDEGLVITGAGIPSGTTIEAVVNPTTATLSQAATATATGVTITIRGRETVYTCAPSFNTIKGNNLLGYDPEGFAEVTEVRTIGGNATAVGFKLWDSAGSVGVWIDLDNAGATIPSQAAACTRAIEITTIATGDTAAQKATKIAAALDADAQFTAVASGDLVTITDAAIGERTAATDFTTTQATGFGVSQWIQGSAPNTMDNVDSVLLGSEIEYVALGRRKSSQTFSLQLDFDINQGGEGVPTDDTPAYPLPGNIVTVDGSNILTNPSADDFAAANGLARLPVSAFRTTVSSARASTTTPVDDDVLQIALPAGTWRIKSRLQLWPNSTSNGGAKVKLAFTGTQTGAGFYTWHNQDSAQYRTGPAGPFGGDFIGDAAGPVAGDNWSRMFFDWDGTIVVTAAGTLSVQWAQQSSVADDLKIYQGSYLTATQLA